MAEFKGGIELISGLKPKNKQTFPLVNAPDIQVDDTGKRLDTKLQDIDKKLEAGVSADTVANIVFTHQTFTELQDEVKENTDWIEAKKTEDSTIAQDIADLKLEVQQVKSDAVYDIAYETETGKFSLLQGEGENQQTINTVTITGGGGGGTGASIAIGYAPNTSGSLTITYDETGATPVNLQYYFYTKDATGDFIGVEATANWTVNGIAATSTVALPSDTDDPAAATINTFNVAPYLRAGTNSIVLRITDADGNVATKRWSINAIDMYLTSTFSDTTTYSGDARISYMAYGSLKKTINFAWVSKDLKEEDIFYTTEISTSGMTSTYTIPHQPHGSYLVKIWAVATVNELTITSKPLFYDIMFTDEGVIEPIIRCAYDGTNLTQYTSKIFKYSVYNPLSLTTPVIIEVDGSSNKLTVDRKEQSFAYKPLDYDEEGSSRFLDISVEWLDADGITQRTSRSIEFKVDKFPYEITPVSGVTFDFNPIGRSNNDDNYDEYEDRGYKMSVSDNFDWINGGWKTDSDGNSYFCVKAGTTMQLSYPLFKGSYTANGKNFKMIFKSTLCKSLDATVMSCLDDTNVGVLVKAQESILSIGGQSVVLPYVENKYIELEYNIQPSPSEGQAESRFTKKEILGLLDADYSRGAIYSSETLHMTEIPLTFGSEDCDVWLYRFKVYENSLDDNDIITNRIADAPNSEEMVARFERNQILDETTQEITPALIKAKCPDLRVITIQCDRFVTGGQGDKKEELTGVVVNYDWPAGGVAHSWVANNVVLKPQGTSSMQYGDSAYNVDIYCKPTKGTVDGEEVETKPAFMFPNDAALNTNYYAMTENSIPVNYFNIKVNVASSENANNAILADDYHTFQPYIRPARQADPKVRDCMEFHPCVIFVQERDLSQANLFNDGQPHFYACGDFGNSKKNVNEKYGNSHGLNIDNPYEAILELLNNNSAPCRWLSTWETKEEEAAVWDNEDTMSLEWRYCSAEENDDAEGVALMRAKAKRVIDWVASTNTSKVGSYTESGNRSLEANERAWITEWKKTEPTLPSYTTDCKEFRLAKFRHQFEDYFIKDSVLYHYLFTERNTMVDNRAKNTFIHTEDGDHWDFVFNYDNDTAKGNNNTGDLVLDYGMEDMDKLDAGVLVPGKIDDVVVMDDDMSEEEQAGNPYIFNAADSVLWTNVRLVFQNDLASLYSTLETAGAWRSGRILEKYSKYQDIKPERLQMADMRRKYLRPYEGPTYGYEIARASRNFFDKMFGKKTYQREKYETYQEKYMSSKYRTSIAKNDDIVLRLYGGQKSTNVFTIVPFSSVYVTVSFDGTERSQRAQKGDIVKIDYTDLSANDLNTSFFSASLLSDIGDLSPALVGLCNFSKAERLQRVILGSANSKYNNPNLTNQLVFGNNPLLEVVDIRNCSAYATSIDLNGCPNLKEIHTTGTKTTDILLANGALIETINLNGVQSLYLRNLNYLNSLTLETYTNLLNLFVENCPSVDDRAILDAATNLRALRLIGLNWSGEKKLETTELFERLYNDIGGLNESNQVIAQSVLAGYAEILKLSARKKEKYNTAWPDLEIQEDATIPDYTVTFQNWDGTTLCSIVVDHEEDCPDPIELGLIDTPIKESTEQYDYTFSGWDKSLEIITSNVIITAVYTESLREYTVKWMNWSGQNVLETQKVPYGGAVYYTGDIPVYNSGEKTNFHLFIGWDTSTTFVTQDLIVRPLWENADVSDLTAIPEDIKDMTPTQIYGLSQIGKLTDFLQDGDYIDIQMGNLPTYNGIEEVEVLSNYSFNGTAAKCVNSGIKLFENDTNWTLAIDFEFKYSSSSTANLVNCYDETTRTGFSLTSSLNTVPSLLWGSSARQAVGRAPLETESYRDIVVIRHIAGDNNLYIYNHDRFAHDIPLKKVTLTNTKSSTTNKSLIFGGYNTGTEARPSYADLATGIIHMCKLYKGDLGEDECLRIAAWPLMTMRFAWAGPEVNYTVVSTGARTNTVFYSQNLLDGKMIMNISGLNTGGYAASTMRSWLSSKVFSGMPLLWQQVLQEVMVYSSEGKPANGNSTNAQVDACNCKIFPPALRELDANYATIYPYMDEARGTISTMTDSTARIKKLRNGEGAASAYATRSPYPEYEYTYWNVAANGDVNNWSNANDSMGVCFGFAV